MFTNGMSESISSKVCLRDVSPQAFNAMLEFMYSGKLDIDDTMDTGTLLLQLLLLADQFGVALLHHNLVFFYFSFISVAVKRRIRVCGFDQV